MQDCKVNILGTEYKIRFEKFGDKDIDGYTDPTSFEIVMRNDNDNNVGDFEELQRKQLRHEVIHAFMNESGLQCNWQHTQQFGQGETTVDWFAIQSPKIFKVFQELDIL